MLRSLKFEFELMVKSTSFLTPKKGTTFTHLGKLKHKFHHKLPEPREVIFNHAVWTFFCFLELVIQKLYKVVELRPGRITLTTGTAFRNEQFELLTSGNFIQILICTIWLNLTR